MEHLDAETRTQLNEMRSIVTKRLYEALTSDKPPKASMLNAAVTWMKSLGITSEPLIPPAEVQAALMKKLAPSMAKLPFLEPEERARLQAMAAAQEEDQDSEGEEEEF